MNVFSKNVHESPAAQPPPAARLAQTARVAARIAHPRAGAPHGLRGSHTRSRGTAAANLAAPSAAEQVSLCEVLDRVLNKGVVIVGDIVISVADVDLIYLVLQVVLTSVETANRVGLPAGCLHPSSKGARA